MFGQENVKCKPKHKVIFAKTHKTGGTSLQVGICFSRYPHDWSEYSLQSWGGMGPALCAPSWTSSSLFPSLHLLSDGHGTNLWEQGAELSRDDHVFHVSGEVQHVCLTLQMERSGSEKACSQRLLTHHTQVASIKITPVLPETRLMPLSPGTGTATKKKFLASACRNSSSGLPKETQGMVQVSEP